MTDHQMMAQGIPKYGSQLTRCYYHVTLTELTVLHIAGEYVLKLLMVLKLDLAVMPVLMF